MTSRQVCITGIGIVSPLGNSVAEFSAALHAGKSGIRVLTGQPPSRGLRVGGVVDIDLPALIPPARATTMDRVAQLASVATAQAVQQANESGTPPDWSTAGIYFGSGIGGVQALETAYAEHFLRDGKRVKPFSVVQAMANSAAGHVAMEYGCHGPSITYSVACSSSAIAIGEAHRAIKHGYANCIIAGGCEALLIPGIIDGWEALRTLAIPDPTAPATACRPFSKDRTGLVLAEGAAALILEDYESARARGATILAILSGYGCHTDATHITKPDAKGQAMAMRAALREAGLAPADIGYINAHGTATLAGDVVESNAIKDVFGEQAYRTAVSSTKSMHGHVMGATGAVEFVATLCALREQFLPPTINLSQPDPECDLDYVPNHAREHVALQHVMSNSFAFGGSNACLIASLP
jgi:3-oxoacyl-[acyl-carrier-protein] synthase II